MGFGSGALGCWPSIHECTAEALWVCLFKGSLNRGFPFGPFTPNSTRVPIKPDTFLYVCVSLLLFVFLGKQCSVFVFFGPLVWKGTILDSNHERSDLTRQPSTKITSLDGGKPFGSWGRPEEEEEEEEEVDKKDI